MISLFLRNNVRVVGVRGMCSSVSQIEYEKAAEHSLDRITDLFDSFSERFPVSSEYDVSHSMGVVTASISKQIGTYVINKQSPNKQIWLSSPISGPKRYDLKDNRWVYSHDNEPLDSLLTRELRSIFASDDIDFKDIY